MHDTYILHIASWYPHEESPYEGDFVDRHIRCISTQVRGIVFFGKAVNKPIVKMQISNYENYKVYKRLFQRAGSLSNYSKYHALANQDINTIIKDHGLPVAIHCHAGFPGLSLSSALAKNYRIPLIFTEHSTIYQQEKLSIKEKLIFWHLNKYISKVDIVCPVSSAHSESISAKCFVKKINVIPNVVTNPFFETLLKKSPSPSKLLHISSLDNDQKNIIDLLKGFNILKNKRPDVSLTLVGNSNITLVKRLIKRHKIDLLNIKIIGPLEHTAIPKLMTEHDLFLLWSRYESFSLVIAESWASGLPVLCNESGGITAENNETLGHLSKNYTPEGLADDIDRTLNRYDEFDITEIRAYAQKRYSEVSIAQKFGDLYNSLSIL